MSIKAYKYRLYPNRTAEQQLFWTLARCKEVYNAGLSERKDAYQLHERSTLMRTDDGQIVMAQMQANIRVREVSYYQQKRDLVAIKQARPEYADIASHVLQDVMMRLDKAFQAFFRRIKNGETPGYPRFQGRNRYNSFTYPDGAGWKLVDATHLHLSKIGTIKITLHRPLEGTIKTVTIKHEVGQWYVIFTCEVPEPEKLPLSDENIGIDLGVTHLATLSDGTIIEHPRYFRRGEKVLARRQQALSRKKKGSHRREKAKRLVGKAHRKIKNQRRDFLHKESRKLVNTYQLIVFEDLQTSNLVRAPKPKQDEQGNYVPNGAAAKGGLNESILDAGWSTFMSMCAVKAEYAGRRIVKVNPAFTSQTCSVCGTVRKKTLEERWHTCECGAEMDRDVNAARNILHLGHQQLLGGTRPTSATA